MVDFFSLLGICFSDLSMGLWSDDGEADPACNASARPSGTSVNGRRFIVFDLTFTVYIVGVKLLLCDCVPAAGFRVELPVIAGWVSGVASCANRAGDKQQRILIAVDTQGLEYQYVPACVALCPELLARSLPEGNFSFG